MRICAGPRHFQAHRPFHVPYKWIRRHRLLKQQVRRALAPLAQQSRLRNTRYSIWRFYATLWRHMHPSYQAPIFRSGRSGYGQLRYTTRWMRTDAWFSRKTRPFPVHRQKRLS